MESKGNLHYESMRVKKRYRIIEKPFYAYKTLPLQLLLLKILLSKYTYALKQHTSYPKYQDSSVCTCSEYLNSAPTYIILPPLDIPPPSPSTHLNSLAQSPYSAVTTFIKMGEPHPAFPSAEPPSSSRVSSALLTSTDLNKLLTQAKPLIAVKQKIIPALERLASLSDQDAIEQILYQEKFNVEERTDEQLANATVPLVYVLYVLTIFSWTVLTG